MCSYVENIHDIKTGKTYVIISKSEGVVYKRVKNEKNTEKLILISDNDAYLPYAINYRDIDEIWQYYAHLSFSDSKYTFNSMLEEKLQDIQKKLGEVHHAVVK
ncbi:MAG: S24/S26 family peptidase [Saprospiraceae bacterium]|nr:S24/S26 family peptidase [Saprospiraceae bacterium]